MSDSLAPGLRAALDWIVVLSDASNAENMQRLFKHYMLGFSSMEEFQQVFDQWQLGSDNCGNCGNCGRETHCSVACPLPYVDFPAHLCRRCGQPDHSTNQCRLKILLGPTCAEKFSHDQTLVPYPIRVSKIWNGGDPAFGKTVNEHKQQQLPSEPSRVNDHHRPPPPPPPPPPPDSKSMPMSSTPDDYELHCISDGDDETCLWGNDDDNEGGRDWSVTVDAPTEATCPPLEYEHLMAAAEDQKTRHAVKRRNKVKGRVERPSLKKQSPAVSRMPRPALPPPPGKSSRDHKAELVPSEAADPFEPLDVDELEQSLWAEITGVNELENKLWGDINGKPRLNHAAKSPKSVKTGKSGKSGKSAPKAAGAVAPIYLFSGKTKKRDKLTVEKVQDMQRLLGARLNESAADSILLSWGYLFPNVYSEYDKCHRYHLQCQLLRTLLQRDSVRLAKLLKDHPSCVDGATKLFLKQSSS